MGREAGAETLGGAAGEEAGELLRAADAVRLARRIYRQALTLQSGAERRLGEKAARMAQTRGGLPALVALTDRAFRAREPRRAIDQIRFVLEAFGTPRAFSPIERGLVNALQTAGRLAPGLALRMLQARLRQETASLFVSDERRALAQYLAARRQDGVRVNLNFLGEAILGEEDAARRLNRYHAALRHPGVEVVSVKISSIFSQIDPVAREWTVEALRRRLRPLFLAALDHPYQTPDGEPRPKMVYLDMEEYRDMSITAEAFMRTLDDGALLRAPAGLALQAYLPDAFAVQQNLTAWSRKRSAAGGAPITLRIVKGANREMERVDASLHGWPQAPFRTKEETDANYKRMLRFALEPANARAVRVGVASHNLFDVAYAYLLAEANGVLGQVQFEMLEGMANAQWRVLRDLGLDVLVYAPVCKPGDFQHALGYLIRRFDENTGPDNFLRHAATPVIERDDWNALAEGFRRSFTLIGRLPDAPRRTQDRRNRPPPREAVAQPSGGMVRWTSASNEPDTDFALPHHAGWAAEIRARWSERCDARATEVPLVIAGAEEFAAGRPAGRSMDPSRPGVVVARFPVAGRADVDRAVAAARRDPDGWRQTSAAGRAMVLRRAAQLFRERRGDLMGAALAEGGKTIAEADPEVSEAVDFCELYAASALALAERAEARLRPKGVVAVVPPWNFPISIPAGGVAAALAAGNTVILKPAPAAVLSGYQLCRCFWDAGVNKHTLQFVFGEDEEGASHLVLHGGVDAVLFTGGTATALRILREKPGLHMLAETGGKNATVVTAAADRDLAIKHVLQSAFSHAGQKCSATSLLVLEDEVYNDPSFRRALCDAVRSLPTGSAWEPATRVGPLIGPPNERLARALQTLEPGESWAVRPKAHPSNPNLWSPAVKWGVRPGSFTHMTELFGPVLGVMRARDLDEAIGIVNATGYGLTSGLESLDEREQRRWAASIRAGNLYINRGTTGAVVMRQPFGGMGKSAVGPGIKAGGPNYLLPLYDAAGRVAGAGMEREPLPETFMMLLARMGGLPASVGLASSLRYAWASYAAWVEAEFGRAHDDVKVVGQDNLRRYVPVGRLCVRVCEEDSWFEILARLGAAAMAGCETTVSFTTRGDDRRRTLKKLLRGWKPRVSVRYLSDLALARAVQAGDFDRVRYAAANRVASVVQAAAAVAGFYIASAPVLADGRFELLWYFREQSVSHDYHRYGNLGARAAEARAEIP